MLSLYASEEFEEQGSLASVMGWSESAGGLGYIVGPGAGVLLASIGNFGTPFIVLGIMFIAILPLIPLALKNTRPRGPTCGIARAEARPPWRSYLIFDVVNAGLGTFLMGASFGALGPTLGDHLTIKLGLQKDWMIGVVYGIPAIVYGVACPIVGILTDKVRAPGRAASSVRPLTPPPLRAGGTASICGWATAWSPPPFS